MRSIILMTFCSVRGEVRMVWNSSRWNVYAGGEEVFVMLVDERLSVMG